jgi:hypothetical protein
MRDDRKIWAVATLGAVLVAGGVLLLFRSPKPAKTVLTAPVLKAANIGLAKLDAGGADSLLREETTLRDPTPLFLPTAWNAGENAIPAAARREPGGSFPGYEPKLTFGEVELQLALPLPLAVPKNAVDSLEGDRPAQTYWGFGQTDWVANPLAPRGAFVEVFAAGEGRRLIALPLLDARPPAGTPWHPLQFMVAIDPAGVVRPPVLIESSRVASVDGYFQGFIVDSLRVGERLGPGFYQICIGP